MIKKRDPQTIALDGMSLASLNILALKAKAGTELMDTISTCAEGCGRPWTNDIVRHQRALLRGATPDVLVCGPCFKAVVVPPRHRIPPPNTPTRPRQGDSPDEGRLGTLSELWSYTHSHVDGREGWWLRMKAKDRD